MDNNPNLYSVLIATVQMIGTAFAVWIAYRQTMLNAIKVAIPVAEKLEEVHTAVNGNLTAVQDKADRYAKILLDNGLHPDIPPA